LFFLRLGPLPFLGLLAAFFPRWAPTSGREIAFFDGHPRQDTRQSGPDFIYLWRCMRIVSEGETVESKNYRTSILIYLAFHILIFSTYRTLLQGTSLSSLRKIVRPELSWINSSQFAPYYRCYFLKFSQFPSRPVL